MKKIVRLLKMITISLLLRCLIGVALAGELPSFIGTVEQPTIDGGVLNQADLLIPPKTSSAHPQNIEDTWATHSHLKTILKAAQETGALRSVLEKSEQMGLPASVAIIPMVESGYNANAKSEKGAAGLWQLMEATAHDYGLTSEQRFSVQRSTTAALTHLKNLYSEFHNWELAFAAYNAGSGRIKAALSQNPNATNIEELSVPAETKQFINRIKSVITLLENKT